MLPHIQRKIAKQIDGERCDLVEHPGKKDQKADNYRENLRHKGQGHFVNLCGGLKDTDNEADHHGG